MKKSYLMQLVNEIVDEYLEEYKKSGRKKRAKDDWTVAQGQDGFATSRRNSLELGRAKTRGGKRFHHPEFWGGNDTSRQDRRWSSDTVPAPYLSSRDKVPLATAQIDKSARGTERSPDPLVHRMDARMGAPTRWSDGHGALSGTMTGRVTAPPKMSAQGFDAMRKASDSLARRGGTEDMAHVWDSGGDYTRRFNAPTVAPTRQSPSRLPGGDAPQGGDSSLPQEAQAILDRGGQRRRGGTYYDGPNTDPTSSDPEKRKYLGRVRSGEFVPAADDDQLKEVKLMETMNNLGYDSKTIREVMKRHLRKKKLAEGNYR